MGQCSHVFVDLMTRHAHEGRVGRHSGPHDEIIHPTGNALSDERKPRTDYDKLLTAVRRVHEGRGAVGWGGVSVGTVGCVVCVRGGER